MFKVINLETLYLERAMGIEPTALAWEARVLPLYDAREDPHSMRFAMLLATGIHETVK
ncbi:MAG: hypothetical protein H6R07_3246 [Proteobacteria bacterium]|nr:hypothetical protein [Pseudomonadota bacterium]